MNRWFMAKWKLITWRDWMQRKILMWWWLNHAVTIGLLFKNPRLWWRIVVIQGYGR